MKSPILDPQVEYLPIAVRGIAIPVNSRPDYEEAKPRPLPSDWVFVFDTETDTVTHGAAQPLVVASYQVFQGEKLRLQGFAYDPLTIMPEEMATLCVFSRKNRLRDPIDADDFRKLFYRFAYDFRGTVTGFNLAFDLARLAHNHGTAQGRFSGGFTLHTHPAPWYPPICVKKLNAAAHKFEFTSALRKRSKAKRNDRHEGPWRGAFVDLKAAGDALLGGRYTLESLAKTLGLKVGKLERPDFSRPFDEKFFKYAFRDVEVTAGCYFALLQRFNGLGLPRNLDKIFSEASLAKAELLRMGIRPWRDVQDGL